MSGTSNRDKTNAAWDKANRTWPKAYVARNKAYADFNKAYAAKSKAYAVWSKAYDAWSKSERENQKYCTRCLGLMGVTYVSGKISPICSGCGGREVRKG